MSIDSMFLEIAQSVYDLDVGQPWTEAILSYQAITKFASSQIRLVMEDGTQETETYPGNIFDLGRKIREAMAESHPEGHAWYTMMVKVTATGAYEFTFDYDHLPAFFIVPDPEDWADEFAKYPRADLQVHVQDWMDGTVKDEDWEIIRKRLRALSPIVWIDAVNDD